MADFPYPIPAVSPFTDISEYIPLMLSAVDLELTRPEVWVEGDRENALALVQELLAWIMTLPTPKLIGTTMDTFIHAFFAAVNGGTWTYTDLSTGIYSGVMQTDTNANRAVTYQLWLEPGEYECSLVWFRGSVQGIYWIDLVRPDQNHEAWIIQNLDMYGSSAANMLSTGTFTVPYAGYWYIAISNQGAKNVSSTGYRLSLAGIRVRKTGN